MYLLWKFWFIFKTWASYDLSQATFLDLNEHIKSPHLINFAIDGFQDDGYHDEEQTKIRYWNVSITPSSIDWKTW